MSRWRQRLGFWKVAVILSVLAAALAVGMSMYVRSLYTYAPDHFEPKDLQRGYHLEQSSPRERQERPR
jgi:hypothetical protein